MEKEEKKSKGKLWFLILILSGLAYLFFTQEPRKDFKGLLDSPPKSAQPPHFTKTHYQPKSKVSALGRLEPQGEIIDLSSSEKDLVAKLLVKEGAKVKKGQELARLELYSERFADIQKINAQLEEAREQLDAETKFGLNQIQEDEVRLKRLEEILPLQIASQEAEVRKLKAELKNAKLELDRLKKLKDRKVVSQQQLDRQSLEVTTTEESLTAANVRWEELKKSKVLDIQLAYSELETSQTELIKLQAGIQIDSLEKELNVAKSRLERTIIRAPQNGEVLELITREGEMVDSKPILKLGNTQQMYVVAEVYESDVQWIKLGQSASITSPAFQEPITGKVDHVGRFVSKNDVLDVDPASDTDARVVEVKIKLAKSKTVSGLSNMQVDVQISVE